MLILNLECQEDTLIANMRGKLTKKEAYKIEHYVIPFIKKQKIKHFVCDCTKLTKMDSEGRYVLLKTKYTLKKQKGNFLLLGVKECLKKDLLKYRMRIH